MIINDVIFNAELEEILDELKSQLSINGIHLLEKTKPTATHIQIQCPYHSNGLERRPSAGIRRSDGLFHCFACGTVHTLPEVVSHCFGRYNDVFGTWGWSWLNRNFATVQKEERKDVNVDFIRFSREKEEKPKHISEEELESYRYFHPYMYKRKLTNEIIELFDIGYDKATKCITFPVRDIHGNTLFIARRSVVTKFFNYPQGVEKPVYGLYEYMQNKDKIVETYDSKTDFNTWNDNTVIICESMIDALTCWVYGKYAVALNGLGNDLQFKQLMEMPCRHFILATDMDEAGMKARKRIKQNLKRKLVTEYIWDVNVAKDINDMDEQMFKNLEEVF